MTTSKAFGGMEFRDFKISWLSTMLCWLDEDGDYFKTHLLIGLGCSKGCTFLTPILCTLDEKLGHLGLGLVCCKEGSFF
ncbi:hypothetical protein CsSME_00043021 [Camellia sinensis var. sinensis]